MTFSVREDLIKDLKGESVRVCNLESILPGWSQGVNPEVENLRDQIEQRLDV